MSSSAPLVITNLVGRHMEGKMESGSCEKRVYKTGKTGDYSVCLEMIKEGTARRKEKGTDGAIK